MAKAGMRRPDPGDHNNHGTENHQTPNYQKNDLKPVPDIQGKARSNGQKTKPK
jgi:hypothetical protein